MRKKKKVIIVLLIIICLIILLIPKRKMYNDGGTVVYDAFLYKIIKWKAMDIVNKEGYITGTELHLFPNNFNSLEYYKKSSKYFKESEIVYKVYVTKEFDFMSINNLFELEGYPLDEYIKVDDEAVKFPDEIYIAFAVCSKECGSMQFIVDGSTQVCEYCGKSMYRTVTKRYSLVK